jgi:hypothetical protein
MRDSWRTAYIVGIIGLVGLGLVAGRNDWSAPAIYAGFAVVSLTFIALTNWPRDDQPRR